MEGVGTVTSVAVAALVCYVLFVRTTSGEGLDQLKVDALERRLVRCYPLAAAVGTVFAVLALLGVGSRWNVVVWLVLVPLWIKRYSAYRRTR